MVEYTQTHNTWSLPPNVIKAEYVTPNVPLISLSNVPPHKL